MPACTSAQLLPHHGCLAAPVPGHVAREEGGEHAGQEQDGGEGLTRREGEEEG